MQRSYPYGNQIRAEIQKLMVPAIKLQIRPLSRHSYQNCSALFLLSLHSVSSAGLLPKLRAKGVPDHVYTDACICH